MRQIDRPLEISEHALDVYVHVSYVTAKAGAVLPSDDRASQFGLSSRRLDARTRFRVNDLPAQSIGMDP
ncbi:hypothetical protein [Breoghania sp. L-A4]|uniref:hypothetical protein n=1 Tax=Breoghania sp. L-A4 TaxID=2304600 RepID=UPI000E35DF8F|nr:hypothetical protein [Breoghania sp. L-A4]AXS39657.1 hypothetical protein D1F64_05830 [Breoghania sp. L-A4]